MAPYKFNSSFDIGKRVFVGGLSQRVTEAMLTEYMSYFGPIEKTQIVRTPTGISKGFGYVTFSDSRSISAIKDYRQELVLDGKHIDVKEYDLSLAFKSRHDNNFNYKKEAFRQFQQGSGSDGSTSSPSRNHRKAPVCTPSWMQSVPSSYDVKKIEVQGLKRNPNPSQEISSSSSQRKERKHPNLASQMNVKQPTKGQPTCREDVSVKREDKDNEATSQPQSPNYHGYESQFRRSGDRWISTMDASPLPPDSEPEEEELIVDIHSPPSTVSLSTSSTEPSSSSLGDLMGLTFGDVDHGDEGAILSENMKDLLGLKFL